MDGWLDGVAGTVMIPTTFLATLDAFTADAAVNLCGNPIQTKKSSDGRISRMELCLVITLPPKKNY